MGHSSAEKEKSKTQAPPSSVVAPDHDSSLSQIRELLHGQQIREFHEQLNEVVQRSSEALDASRNELLDRQRSFEKLTTSREDNLEVRLADASRTAEDALLGHAQENRQALDELRSEFRQETAEHLAQSDARDEILQGQLDALKSQTDARLERLEQCLAQDVVGRQQLVLGLKALTAAFENPRDCTKPSSQ